MSQLAVDQVSGAAHDKYVGVVLTCTRYVFVLSFLLAGAQKRVYRPEGGLLSVGRGRFGDLLIRD